MTPARPAPVLFLGFDAADAGLIERGIADGSLPTVARLLRDGAAARLAPVPSGFHNTSWLATVTGMDVDQHGAFLDRQLEPGTYRIVDVRASAIQREPFWRAISAAGLRSTILSIYSTAVIPDFLGTQIQGWGTIDPYSAKFGEVVFDPPEAGALLREAAPDRPNIYRAPLPRTPKEQRSYVRSALESIDEQTRALTTLAERTEWDFFFGSYAETHHGGHLLWHLSDPDHPLHDPASDETTRDAVTSLYRAVDAGIGRVIERVPADTRVFVLTPHGMRPNYVGDPGAAILERAGWLVAHANRSAGGLGQRVKRGAWRLGRRIVPERARLAARSRISADMLAAMPLAHVDWSQTRAFALPSDMTTYVRVNLAGREPEGIVQPGREYDRACDELVELFSTLTIRETGAPAAERVVRCAVEFRRPVDGAMPDVCVVWAADAQVRALRSPIFGDVVVPFDDPRTGQHRHEGFVVGCGPGIPSSGGRTLGAVAGSLLDIGPTALALLGVEQRPELRGRPLATFVRPG